jgi:GxxExxY protein
LKIIRTWTRKSTKTKKEVGHGRYYELCDVVRETGYAIHRYHRHGHLEKVYENALVSRLRKLGLEVKQQHPLAVFDEDGAETGEYFADLFVENHLIVELKACRSLADEHVAQLLGYLRAARIEHGLLLNFGAIKFQVKKYALGESYGRTPVTACIAFLTALFVSFAPLRG